MAVYNPMVFPVALLTYIKSSSIASYSKVLYLLWIRNDEKFPHFKRCQCGGSAAYLIELDIMKYSCGDLKWLECTRSSNIAEIKFFNTSPLQPPHTPAEF